MSDDITNDTYSNRDLNAEIDRADELHQTHSCPRRAESFVRDDAVDTWPVHDYSDAPGIINNSRRSCSYCRSLHPDDFMAAIRDGAEIGPTDKSYKAYVEWDGSPSRGKFYYQHLSEEQRREFVALLNDGTMRVGYPGYFYVLPFFAKRADR